MNKKNNRGFTLIEITAVVLILGVIFLISYPTMERLLKKSEQDKEKYNKDNIIMNGGCMKDKRICNDNMYPVYPSLTVYWPKHPF